MVSSGHSSRAISTVGTPRVIVARSVSMSSSMSEGSKARTDTWRTPACRVPRVPRTQPAVWNMGNGLTYTSPALAPDRVEKIRALLVRPRWCSSAPFGNPVVPDVYWI